MKLDLSPAPRARLGRWPCALLLTLLLTACDESNTQADAADNKVIAAVRHSDGSTQAPGSLPGGLNQPARTAIGEGPGQPELCELNQQKDSSLRDKTQSDSISIDLPAPPYHQSEL